VTIFIMFYATMTLRLDSFLLQAGIYQAYQEKVEKQYFIFRTHV